MTQASVRKAVFPVAELGMGFVSASGSAPKELLTIVDKPLIYYAVAEAVAAGLREMIFVTGRNTRPVEGHLQQAYEREAVLAVQQRCELVGELRNLFPADVHYVYVQQQAALGPGNAIASARALIGDEPFAVVIPDELIDAPSPAIGQLLETFVAWHEPAVAVYRSSGHAGAAHGFASGTPMDGRTYRVTRATAHGDGAFALAGRFVFTPEIFDYLTAAPADEGGEIELVDAIERLATDRHVLAREIDGKRFDCGTKLGYLGATLHFGLRHPQLGAPFARLVREAKSGDEAPRPTVRAPTPIYRRSAIKRDRMIT